MVVELRPGVTIGEGGQEAGAEPVGKGAREEGAREEAFRQRTYEIIEAASEREKEREIIDKKRRRGVPCRGIYERRFS